MTARRLRRLLISASAILLALALMVPIASAQAPPQDEAGRDPAVGAINPSYRVSDSPWLQVPEEMLAWPQMMPPEPGEVQAVDLEDPTAVVVHNIATGETTQIPSSEAGQPSQEASLRSTPGYSGLLPPGLVPESVFPPDDRVRVTAVTSFPWRTVTKLFMTFPNGASGGCSGAIIGCADGHGYHILTAGHCIYSHGNGGWATSVKIFPGLDGSYAPYNYAWATNLRSYTGWTNSAMTEHDWAMVTLDRNVGDFTGWMGRITASSSNSMYTGTANTAGYPCNVAGGTCTNPVTPSNTQWFDADSGRTATEYNHWYWMDTQPGQSGSPVWRYVDPDRHIMTVHTSGNDGSGSNHGTRLNQNKFDQVNTWCSADTPPTDRADLIDDGQAFAGFSPTTVSPGDTSFTAWSDVRNVGTAASGGFYVQYRASTNTICSGSDFLIGTDYVPSISAFNWANSDWTGTFPSGLADGNYYLCWIIDSGGNVTEFDESNNTAYKSSPQLVVCNLPSTPSPVSPGNGSSTCDTTPLLDWSTVSGADYYQIQVDDSSSFSTPVINTTTASSSYTPSSSLGAGTYYWRVRAHNSCGYGSWSTIWSFTVLVPPPAPSLSTPANGSSTCDTTPYFDWSAVSGATSYQIQVDDSSTFSSPEIDTTTASSNYTASSALPPGTYYWRVRSSNTCGWGSWSSARSFTVVVPPSAAPSLRSPANGSSTCDTTPTFQWSALSGATSYQIQVDNDPGFGSPEIDTTTGSSSYTPGSALPPGTYYWRVRGSNTCGDGPWSTGWVVTVVVPPSTAPDLTTPSNGSSTCDATPTFGWSPVSGADSYQIQVDNDSGFGSPEIDTTTASAEFTPGAALPPGTYYWRVRASNTCGDGPWSTGWAVTVVVPPSTAPGLTTPSNSSSTCDTTPTFGWSPVNGADSYQIQVDNDSGFGSPEIDTTTASAEFTPGAALPAGTYYWRVRGANTCGDGPWSTRWTVTILAPPSAPELAAPANGSSTCDTTPTFDWSTVSGATSYQIQVDDDPGFGSPDLETTAATSEFTPGAALPAGTYYWRVRASNDCGYGSWSAAWSTTVVVAPSVPSLLAPANGASTTDTTPDLDWSSVSGAVSYRIQVADNPGFAPSEIDTTAAASDYTPASPLALGWHYWRVYGSNSCGDSPWSTVYNYRIVTRLYLPVTLRSHP